MKANNNNSLDLIIEKVLDIALYWKAEAEKAKEELKNQQVYETKKKIAELDKEIERLRDAPIEKPYFPFHKNNCMYRTFCPRDTCRGCCEKGFKDLGKDYIDKERSVQEMFADWEEEK